MDISQQDRNVYSPKVACSADGTRLAVAWYGNSVTGEYAPYTVRVSTSHDGGATWTSPTPLSVPTGDHPNVTVVVSADGNRVTVFWSAFQGVWSFLWSCTSKDGGRTWYAPVILTASVNRRIEFRVAALAGGDCLAALWSIRQPGTLWVVQASLSWDGGLNWGPSDELCRNELNTEVDIGEVLGSADGSRLTAVWTVICGHGSSKTQASTYQKDAQGRMEWSAPADWPTARPPRVRGSAKGDQLVAAWGEHSPRSDEGSPSPRNYIMFASSSRDGGGTWSAPISVFPWSWMAFPPQLTMSADGTRVTALWAQHVEDRTSQGDPYVLQASSSNDGGGTWSAPIDISLGSSIAQWPQLRASESGEHLTAVWQRAPANSEISIVQASCSTDGGKTWSAPLDLSADSLQSARPDLAVARDGSRATAVWMENDKDHISLQTRTFEVPPAAEPIRKTPPQTVQHGVGTHRRA